MDILFKDRKGKCYTIEEGRGGVVLPQLLLGIC